MADLRIFEELESRVRGYVRSFPTVFDTASGSELFDEDGRRYVDFFAGAGALNYGHNHPRITAAMVDYLRRGGIVHGLDKATVAKRAFLEKLRDTILRPRGLDYRVQFTGPTGTNAVETALKLARLVKRRSGIVAFTNGYHGLTLGALAATGNAFYRDEAYGLGAHVTFMPFDGYFGPETDTIAWFERFLEDGSSGVDVPAAVLVETVQGEGGVNVATVAWLQRLEALCRRFDMLLIVDDIQVGNGRTGDFFSFERAGITPDLVTLSKSVGGGLPLALLLLRPEHDQWEPGEHTGTFRGNNLAFVAAAEALAFWDEPAFGEAVVRKGERLRAGLEEIAARVPQLAPEVRGLGMIRGLALSDPEVVAETTARAFERGLVIETAGARGQVLKCLPALTIDDALLEEGLGILGDVLDEAARRVPA